MGANSQEETETEIQKIFSIENGVIDLLALRKNAFKRGGYQTNAVRRLVWPCLLLLNSDDCENDRLACLNAEKKRNLDANKTTTRSDAPLLPTEKTEEGNLVNYDKVTDNCTSEESPDSSTK